MKIQNFQSYSFVSSDMYSKRISLTYNGDDEFKSLFGGVVSTVIRLIVFVISIMLLVTIFQRGKTTQSINKIFRDITNDETKHYFAKDNVYFAFKLNGPNPEKMLDSTYFNLEFLQVSYK